MVRNRCVSSHPRNLTGAAAIVLALQGCSAQLWASGVELPVPEGPVVLTVTGLIGVTNADGAAVFDLAMIEAMADASFETSTIWTEGITRFEGIVLRDLLDRVGAEGSRVLLVALNDYVVEIPTDEIGADAPLLAVRRDGARMPVRDRGPLWVVYPYDAQPEFRTELVYMRSIWQLARIEVRD